MKIKNIKIIFLAIIAMFLVSTDADAFVWKTQIWVNAGSDVASVTVGADLNASNGFDRSFDAPVRFRQGQKLAAYFDHAAWAAWRQYFLVDIRDHGLPKEWSFYVQTTYGSLLMGWDTMDVPNTMSLELVDVLTGQSTDMMALSDYSFTSSSSTPREFKIIASGYVSGLPPVDTTEPTTNITSSIPACNGAGDIVINYTGSDNETATGDLQYSYSINNGAWSAYTYSTSHTIASPADGDYSFAVKAKDIKGNVDLTPAETTFAVDTTAPVLSINSPSPSSLWSGLGDTVNSTISGYVVDGGCGLQSVSYTLTDEYGNANDSGIVSIDGSGNYSFVITMDTDLNSGDNDRVYTVTVEATDVAGLITTSQSNVTVTRMPLTRDRRNRSN